MASHRKSLVSFSEAFASTAAVGVPGPYNRHGLGSNFIQESFHSSTDYPTYIAWQTLSTDLSERMRQGSVRLSRTNTIEYAPITEENGEKTPLFTSPVEEEFSESAVSMPAVQQGIAWTVAAFLLVNSALGAGVLNYPAAYDHAGGILAATFLQIVSPFFAVSHTSEVLSTARQHTVKLSAQPAQCSYVRKIDLFDMIGVKRETHARL